MTSRGTLKKIALFVPSFRGGGAERAMLLFADGLLSLGYQVDFLVAQDEGPLKSSLPDGVRLFDLAQKKVSFTLPSLVRYLRRERPAALYSTIVNANITAIFARAVAHIRCPVVIRESNVVNPKQGVTISRKASGLIAPFIYRLADSIISVSEAVADELCASAPSLRKKISVLPNPVISEKIHELANAPLNHPWFPLGGEQYAVSPVIVGAGRLHPQKDFSTLISAFAEVRKTRPLHLLILGEGSERPKLEEQVVRLGLGQDVSLPGHVENPFPYLKRAQTFVLSSRYEGMPNALLQAMAFGTPVVATECHSGAREVVTNTEFGRLVPVGNVPAMAAAIADCLLLPRSASAAEFIEERFSVKRATEEYLHVAGL